MHFSARQLASLDAAAELPVVEITTFEGVKCKTPLEPLPNDVTTKRLKQEAAHWSKYTKCSVKRLSTGLLDLDTVPDDYRTKLSENNVRESPFIRLPPELRNKIYKEVLHGKHIHIFGSGRNSIHQLTSTSHFSYSLSVARSRVGKPANRGSGKRNCNAEKLTMIQTVCRAVYRDTALLPYEMNAFSFESREVMKHWVDSRWSIQKQAVHSLYAEHLDGFGRVRDFWKEFPNLRNIRLSRSMTQKEHKSVQGPSMKALISDRREELSEMVPYPLVVEMVE